MIAGDSVVVVTGGSSSVRLGFRYNSEYVGARKTESVCPLNHLIAVETNEDIPASSVITTPRG